MALLLSVYLLALAATVGRHLVSAQHQRYQGWVFEERFLTAVTALPLWLTQKTTFRFAEDHWQVLRETEGAERPLTEQWVKQVVARSGPALVLPWLVIVPFIVCDEPAQRGRVRRLLHGLRAPMVLIAVPDSCDRDTLRRLRVLLRWHAAA